MSLRIGVPCPYMDPNWVSAVSAWASKWTTDTRPHPTCRATPVTSGRAMVWSPPRTTGTEPARAAPGPVRRAPVEGGADDHSSRSSVAAPVPELGRRDAREGGVGAVHGGG